MVCTIAEYLNQRCYQGYPSHFIFIYLQIIQVECPESDVTEIRVWRRFNDFKKLYKSMSKLHSALHRHRKETFPPFVKSQIFGK